MDQTIKEKLFDAVQQINKGITLEEVLHYMYAAFEGLIPYDRISLALLDEQQKNLSVIWVQSKGDNLQVDKDYSANIENSSLQRILQDGRPRILLDLEQYLADHPSSVTTQKIVAEGIHSNLTCPLSVQGKPIGFVFFSSFKKQAYSRDHEEIFMAIADHIAIVAEKSRLYHQLQDLNSLKNKFLGIAAHDLKSPLASIVLYADTLKDELVGPMNPQQKKFAGLISDMCDKMAGLINDLLNVSIIESNAVKVSLQPVEMHAFIHDVFERHQFLAQAKGIRMTIDLPHKIPILQIDPNRMEQVLSNLLSNAVKYSHSDTSIHLRAYIEQDECVISVQDQGQGIPAKELPKLFQFFSKASSKPTAGETSTGLGLAIAKKMVEAHQGRIWAESVPEKGSTFFVALPINSNSK